MANQTIRNPILDKDGNVKEVNFSFDRPTADGEGRISLDDLMTTFGGNYEKLDDLKNAPDKTTFGQMLYNDDEMSFQPDNVFFPFKKQATADQKDIFNGIAVANADVLIRGIEQNDPRNLEKLVVGKSRGAKISAFEITGVDNLPEEQQEFAQKYNGVTQLVRKEQEEKEKLNDVGSDIYVAGTLHNLTRAQRLSINAATGGRPDDTAKLAKILVDYHTSKAVSAALEFGEDSGIDTYVEKNLAVAQGMKIMYEREKQTIQSEQDAKLNGRLMTEEQRTTINNETAQRMNGIDDKYQHAGTGADYLVNGFTQVAKGAADKCKQRIIYNQAIADAAAQAQS